MVKLGIARQQGVALLTVVLIVSIVTILATAMATRQHLDIRRAASFMMVEQMEQYSRGIDAVAVHYLADDADDNDFDGLDDIWAMPIPPIPIDENSSISGELIDLNRYLNVNNLVDHDGKPVTVEIERMRRLFTLLEIQNDLVNALVDWIDPKQDIYGSNGAEDNDYLLLDPPYRTADDYMLSISELHLVKGFTPEVMAKLRDPDSEDYYLLTALPSGTKLNINTAPAVLLEATFEKMTNIQAETLAGNSVYEELSKFMVEASVTQSTNNDSSIEPLLDVSSDYFMLSGETFVGNREMKVFSLLKRDNSTGKSTVIYRSQGVF